MRVNTRMILEECIDMGLASAFYWGSRKYSKKDMTTWEFFGDESFRYEIEGEIWRQILEKFKFEDPYKEYNHGKCNENPEGPHEWDRVASDALNRYVCRCENWKPKEKI